MAHAEVYGTHRQTELGHVVAKIEKSHAGLGTQTNGCGSDLNLCTGIPVNPQIVAHCQRPITNRFEPVTFATWLKRDGAFDMAQSSGASWRILVPLILLIRWVVLRECTRGVLAKQQNCRRKYCKGKSCAFFHEVPHCDVPEHRKSHLEFSVD